MLRIFLIIAPRNNISNPILSYVMMGLSVLMVRRVRINACRFLLPLIFSLGMPLATAQSSDQELPSHHITFTKLAWSGVAADDIEVIMEKAKIESEYRYFEDSQLTQLTAQLKQELRVKGYFLAQVLISADDRASYFQTGVLNLHIYPGKIGVINIVNSSAVKTTWITSLAENVLCPNGIGNACLLTKARFERFTQIIQDVAGLQVASIEFSPHGVDVGQTKLSIAIIAKGSRIKVAVGADNYGFTSTGKSRVDAKLETNNVFGVGDVFVLNTSLTEKNNFSGGLDVDVPIALNGLSLRSSVYRNQFALPSLYTTGIADSVNIGLTYPLVRGLDFNLIASISAVDVMSEIVTLDKVTSNKNIYAGQFLLAANSGDRTFSLGYDAWTLQSALMEGSVSDVTALPGLNSSLGHFTKLSYQALKKQTVWKSNGIYALMNIRGQLVSGNLDPYEKLGLSGVSGARGYSAEQGSVDQGIVTSVDFRKDINSSWGRVTTGVFFDYANGMINRNSYANWQIQNGYANHNQSNHLVLSDYGVSLSWDGPYNIELNTSWARQFNSSPVMLNSVLRANSQFWLALKCHF